MDKEKNKQNWWKTGSARHVSHQPESNLALELHVLYQKMCKLINKQAKKSKNE